MALRTILQAGFMVAVAGAVDGPTAIDVLVVDRAEKTPVAN